MQDATKLEAIAEAVKRFHEHADGEGGYVQGKIAVVLAERVEAALMGIDWRRAE